jgi:addiction module RelE/StbE family toxin
MSRYKIEIAEPAENDLYELSNYIAKELLEPDIALRLVDKIGYEIIKLEDMPLRNGLVIDERLAFQGIRRIIVDNYTVFYVVEEEYEIVTIIRILYSRRDWINLL